MDELAIRGFLTAQIALTRLDEPATKTIVINGMGPNVIEITGARAWFPNDTLTQTENSLTISWKDAPVSETPVAGNSST